jgi:hypothetical protein
MGVMAIKCFPCPMIPMMLPMGSISTLSNPTASISCLILKMTFFSSALSLGMAIISRKNLAI